MFEKLTETICEQIESIGDTIKEEIRYQNRQFNTSRFNDPLAEKTDWGPCKSGGSSFRTHRLFPEVRGAMRFKPTFVALMFGGIFLTAGIGSGVLMFSAHLSGTNPPPLPFIIIFPLVFSSFGIFMLRSFMTPIVFSSEKGYFWKGYINQFENPERKKLKTYCHLKDIHALQVLSEYCTGSSTDGETSSYKSYELNLVLKDGSRLNVVDYGNKKKIREDAMELSKYLKVPVWDGTRW